MIGFVIGIVIGGLLGSAIRGISFDIKRRDKHQRKEKQPIHFKGEWT